MLKTRDLGKNNQVISCSTVKYETCYFFKIKIINIEQCNELRKITSWLSLKS